MDLNFTKTSEGWVSTFQVEADFNLHIEMPELGVIKGYQRGCEEGEYDEFLHINYYDSKTIDYDITALVYPKWIKIVTKQEPTKAVVTSSEE